MSYPDPEARSRGDGSCGPSWSAREFATGNDWTIGTVPAVGGWTIGTVPAVQCVLGSQRVGASAAAAAA